MVEEDRPVPPPLQGEEQPATGPGSETPGPSRPSGGSSGGGGTLLLLAGLLLFLLVLAVSPFVVAMAWRGRLDPGALGAERATVSVQLAKVENLRPYGLRPYRRVDPTEAGEALHAVLRAGAGPAEGALRSVPETEDRPWFPERPPGLFGLGELEPERRASAIAGAAFEQARRGFDRRQVSYLRRLASHPGFRHLSTVARAPEVNVVGGRYRFPLPDTLPVTDLPMSGLRSTGDAAHAAAARAALALHWGDVDRAERVLREALTMGLQLAEHSPFPRDVSAGVHAAGTAREYLARLYETTGRRGRARRLRAAIDEGAQGSATPPGGDAPSSLARLRSRAAETALDSSVHRPVRWDRLTLLAVLPCTSTREILFGPKADFVRTFDDAAEQLARWPEEEQLIARMESSLTAAAFSGTGDHAPPTAHLGRVTGWFLSPLFGRRLRGCATLLGRY